MALSKQDKQDIKDIFDEGFERNFGPAFEKSFGPAFEKSFGPAFEKSFGPAFEKSFGPAFERNFGPAFEKSFEPAFEKSIEPFASAIQGDIQNLRKEMAEGFHELRDDVSYIRKWTAMLDSQIDDIRKQLDKVVYRRELEALEKRVDKLEKLVESIG